MIKKSSLIYILVASLGVLSVFLIIKVPQIYGWASLSALLLGLILFTLIKKSRFRWASLAVTLSVAVFFLFSGFSFHFENSRNRLEFNKDTAVKFEEGAFANHLAKAKRENKKVFLDVYTAWCGPCLQFNKTILSDNEVAEVMNEAFINVKVDAEVGEGIEIGKKYVIQGYPTLLILNSDGTVIEHVNPDWMPDKKKMKETANKYL